jgi:O-antigen ligase
VENSRLNRPTGQVISRPPVHPSVAPLLMLGAILLTLYAGLTDSFPRVFGLLVGAGLLVFAVERAVEWIVAILLVGQFLLHWITSLGGGDISRDNPLSGPLLPMYALTGCLVVARVMLRRRKQSLPPWPPQAQFLMLAAVLLGVMIAAGLLYSPAPLSARGKTLGYIAFNLAPSALVILMVDSEERQALLVRAVIIVGIAMAVLTHLGQGATGGGEGLYNIGEGKHGLSIGGARFAGGTWFARRLDLVLISLLTLVALSRSKIALFSMLALLPYLCYLLFLSGSRGAIAGGAVAFMVILALLTAMTKSGRALRITMVAVLLLVVAVGMGAVREEAVSHEIVARYTVLQRPFQTEAAGADRLQFWRSAWDIFQDHPVFGIGSGGWGMVWNKQDYRDYPHNIFLEILCEQGMVGGLLFALFFFGTVLLAWKVMRHPLTTQRGQTLTIWAIGILTFAGLDAQLSGDIQTNDYIWMASAIICVLARTSACASRPAAVTATLEGPRP